MRFSLTLSLSLSLSFSFSLWRFDWRSNYLLASWQARVCKKGFFSAPRVGGHVSVSVFEGFTSLRATPHGTFLSQRKEGKHYIRGYEMHIFSHYLCLLDVHQHETRAMVQQCLAAPVGFNFCGRMWSCQGNIKSTTQHPGNHPSHFASMLLSALHHHLLHHHHHHHARCIPFIACNSKTFMAKSVTAAGCGSVSIITSQCGVACGLPDHRRTREGC